MKGTGKITVLKSDNAPVHVSITHKWKSTTKGDNALTGMYGIRYRVSNTNVNPKDGVVEGSS